MSALLAMTTVMVMNNKFDELLNKKWAVPIGATLCALLWGSAYPVIKYSYAALAIDSVPDRLMFAGARFMLAGVTVWLFALAVRRRPPTIPRERIGSAVLYGVLQTGLMYILNYIGVANTTASKTSMLTASSAFFAVLLAPIFFRGERLTALKAAGAAVGFSGVILVNLGGLSGGFGFGGEGLVLLAAILNTAGSFVGKRAARGMELEMTAYQLMIGAALILAAGLVMGGSFVVTAQGMLLTVYLAFVSAAAFALWTALLTRHEAGRVLIFNLLIPVFGSVWAFVILGERQIFDPMFLLSLALISLGIFMVNHTKNFQKTL